MKAEINNENKAKFFAQYWGQKILTTSINLTILDGKWIDRIESGECDAPIELKSIVDISDEDVDHIATILNPERINRHNPKVFRNKECAFINFQGYEVATVFFNGTIMYKDLNGVDTYTLKGLSAYDFLRSRGYLVPWMGLSVDEIIEDGWAKYK